MTQEQAKQAKQAKQAEMLALMGADASLKNVATDPAIWRTFQDYWATARGAPMRVALAMWAEVEPPRIVEALCAVIRTGISGNGAAADLERVLSNLEAWVRAPSGAETPDAIRGDAERIAKVLADIAWHESGQRSEGEPWNLLFWAWATESAADYASQWRDPAAGEIYWGVIQSFVGTVADRPITAESLVLYERCSASARSYLGGPPSLESLRGEPRGIDDEGDSYVEVGFNDEASWANVERCWLALRPARVLRADPGDGDELWDLVARLIPSSEEHARDVLASVDQCEIATRLATRVSGSTGRLHFVPLAFPYGGTGPIKWFAEAFGLRVLSVKE